MTCWAQKVSASAGDVMFLSLTTLPFLESVSVPEAPMPIGGGQDIRYAVLHLSGPPITQCSTSRLFAFITHYGAQPLGLEWVNDSSCNVVFSNASAARLAIEYLCPAVNTRDAPFIALPNDEELEEAVERKGRLDNGEESGSEWSEALLRSLLMPRKAHRIPAKLYNAPERDAAAELHSIQEGTSKEGESELPDDVPEIYREMEAEDRKRQMLRPEVANLLKLRGTIWLRWALESMDVKPSRAAKQSKWYREHGNDAGKEVVTKLLDVGGAQDRLELLPESRERPSTTILPANRGRGSRQAAMDGLDAEMDAWRAKEDDTETDAATVREQDQRRSLPAWGHQPPRRRGRGEGRGRMTMESLDEELDWDRRDRSASPARVHAHGDTGGDMRAGGRSVKVKGRGRMKAPSAWDDADNGRMHADAGGRWRQHHHHHQPAAATSASLEQRMSQSLNDRIQGPNSLQDRLG